ncbi:MAG: aminoacyl-tRNA hydrolase [Acidobacteriota bacterium]
MRLIVGLGNPGLEYEWTRHNCGFLVVEELARRAGAQIRMRQCQALTGRAIIEGESVLLVKPQTFMNESGVAVAALRSKYEVSPACVLVIADELALPFGQIRLRRSGSAGGHNGLKSVIARLGADGFPRLRLGIGKDHPIDDAAGFVLSEFPRRERDALSEMVARAAGAVEAVLKTGIDDAMSKYN